LTSDLTVRIMWTLKHSRGWGREPGSKVPTVDLKAIRKKGRKERRREGGRKERREGGFIPDNLEVSVKERENQRCSHIFLLA
jgi:hypothetical protein